MSVNIALPTRRTPTSTGVHDDVVAVIIMTPERARELLDLMQDITRMATECSRHFKISSFEASAIYVPAVLLDPRPAANDFLILDPDFQVTDVTEVYYIQAGVMPFTVAWEAHDPEGQFTLTTIELDAELLRLIERGETFKPGDTSATIKNGFSPAKTKEVLISKEQTWIN